MEGYKVLWLHTSTVEAEVVNEFCGCYFVVKRDRVFEILVKRLVDDISDEFCDPPFGGEVVGVVVSLCAASIRLRTTDVASSWMFLS